jgi:hypothetical protein
MQPLLDLHEDWLRTEPTIEEVRTKLGLDSAHKAKQLRYYLRQHGAQGAASKPSAPTETQAAVHLVIGDAHVAPGQDLRRFTWLGRMVAALRPTNVISIGDWATMESLSSYDKGRRSAENRRYSRDISAVNESLRLYHRELPKNWKARHDITMGNHEYRILRYGEDTPQMDICGYEDMEFEKRGWRVHPFLTPVVIDGVSYSHYWQNQNSRFAIGGVNAARNLLLKKLTSCVAGHSHLLQWYTISTETRRLHGLVCGSYFEHRESYANQSNEGWWSGICVLRNVRDGDYDLEMWSMSRVRKEFG